MVSRGGGGDCSPTLVISVYLASGVTDKWLYASSHTSVALRGLHSLLIAMGSPGIAGRGLSSDA